MRENSLSFFFFSIVTCNRTPPTISAFDFSPLHCPDRWVGLYLPLSSKCKKVRLYFFPDKLFLYLNSSTLGCTVAKLVAWYFVTVFILFYYLSHSLRKLSSLTISVTLWQSQSSLTIPSTIATECIKQGSISHGLTYSWNVLEQILDSFPSFFVVYVYVFHEENYPAPLLPEHE